MKVTVSRKAHFNAAHRLYRKDWSMEQNNAIFGKCNNPNYHGHNYELIVSVTGEIDQETGFVIDLKELKRIITVYVIDVLDHKNINLDVNFMKGKMASTEVLAVAIFDVLEPHVQKEGAILHSIKLYETENNFVEYFG